MRIEAVPGPLRRRTSFHLDVVGDGEPAAGGVGHLDKGVETAGQRRLAAQTAGAGEVHSWRQQAVDEREVVRLRPANELEVEVHGLPYVERRHGLGDVREGTAVCESGRGTEKDQG